jgi:uncharacterized protein YqeY
MIRQRRDAIVLYQQAGRDELAEREGAEIEGIQRFLPKQLNAEEIQSAIEEVIDELAAGSIKDMGRVMSTLRERYGGRMEFAKASTVVKQQLS